jgi:hypothetical protein
MRRWFHYAALALSMILGCYTGPELNPSAHAVTQTDPTIAAGPSDLPCDVASLMSESCGSCHGNPLSGGAPTRLLSRSDLAAQSKLDPSKTVADDCVARMKDKTQPMPPTGLLGADRVAILENWVNAGMLAGSCATQPTQATSASTATSTSTSPDTPSVCTSGRHWTGGDRRSEFMHPGVACIDCHSRDDGPSYRIAGTVYATAHEPNDCDGSTGSIAVELTDANGKTYSLPVNSAGNFYTPTRLAMPYTAKVVSGAKTRAMVGSQTNGDCNTCHTEVGDNDAPGRIMAP